MNSEVEFKESKLQAYPTKTGSNWAPAKISKHWIQFQGDPDNVWAASQILKAVRIFKFGHSLTWI